MHTDVLMSSSSYNPITKKTNFQIHIFFIFFHLPSHIHVRSSQAFQADEYACDLLSLRAQPCWGPYHIPLCWTFRCWPRAFDAWPDRVLLSAYLSWNRFCIQFKWRGELAMHIRLPSRHASLKYSLSQGNPSGIHIFLFQQQGNASLHVHQFLQFFWTM